MSIKKAGFGCHPDYLDMTGKRKGLPKQVLPRHYQNAIDGKPNGPFPSLKYALKSPEATTAHYKRREH